MHRMGSHGNRNDRGRQGGNRNHGGRNNDTHMKAPVKKEGTSSPAMKMVKNDRKETTPISRTPISRKENHKDHKDTDRRDDRRDDKRNLKRDRPSDETNALPLEPQGERKFTGRCRLFVGNLPSDISEADFKKMFEPYGELSEVFLNPSRGFGFVRLDTRANAEAAKAALDGTQQKGRFLRVRFATHGAALRVKYIPNHVSNELLEQAFTQFGQVERAIVIVDDRGRATGEGIVEFARKPGAQAAINRINEGAFLLTASPRPIVVEPLEQRDEEDGLPERFIGKGPEFKKERDAPPRFANRGTFEHEFAAKWKDLYAMEKQQQEVLKGQLEGAAKKLEDEMDTASHEHQAMMLRQDLLRRQEELRRLEEQHQQELNRRMEIRRAEEDMRLQQEESKRREMEGRRRRPEDLFAQQERAMHQMRNERNSNNLPPMAPPPAPPVGLGIEGRQRQGTNGMGGIGGGGMNNQGGMGMHGNNHGGNNMQQPMQRQSRFDQPPQQGGGNMGGGGGGGNGGFRGNMGQGMGGNQNMGGNMGQGNNMMGRNNMGGQQMGGGGGGSGGGSGMGGGMNHMGRDHGMMDRDGRESMRDDYYDSKRPRRY